MECNTHIRSQGIYQAEVSDSYFSIDKLQVARKWGLAGQTPTCVGRGTWYPTSVAHISVSGKRLTDNQSTHKVTAGALQDAKLQFLYNKLETISFDNFVKNWKYLCNLASWNLRLSRLWLKVDPTLGMRALLNIENIQATWSGDTVLVSPCRNVTVVKVYEDHKEK